MCLQKYLWLFCYSKTEAMFCLVSTCAYNLNGIFYKSLTVLQYKCELFRLFAIWTNWAVSTEVIKLKQQMHYETEASWFEFSEKLVKKVTFFSPHLAKLHLSTDKFQLH